MKIAAASSVVAAVALATFLAVASAVFGGADAAGACGAGTGVVVGAPGSGTLVGASTYGGPRDSGAGSSGYRQDDLDRRPDSYAELGYSTTTNETNSTTGLLGNLEYLAALRVTAPTHKSAVLYKRDVGAGGADVVYRGRRYRTRIDLWHRAAQAMGLPSYWKGVVRVERVEGSASPGADQDPPGAGACAGARDVLGWPSRQKTVTSSFCEVRSWESCHPGVDFAVASGSPIYAAGDGRVTTAGPASGYGNLVCIDHGAGLTTCYAHLRTVRVSAGQAIRRGAVVAISDCTGRCYGAHLHFEVRLHGRPVCPARYLGAAPSGMCVKGSPGY